MNITTVSVYLCWNDVLACLVFVWSDIQFDARSRLHNAAQQNKYLNRSRSDETDLLRASRDVHPVDISPQI